MPEIDPLTQAVYDYIAQYIRNERRSPTLREVGTGCHVSHTTIITHLARLEGMGWIEREYGTPRSIRLGELAPDYDPPADDLRG